MSTKSCSSGVEVSVGSDEAVDEMLSSDEPGVVVVVLELVARVVVVSVAAVETVVVVDAVV